MERIWISQRHTQRIIQCVIRQVLTDSGGKENKKTTILGRMCIYAWRGGGDCWQQVVYFGCNDSCSLFLFTGEKGQNREKGKNSKNRKKSPAGMKKYGCRTGEDRQSGVWM